MSSDRAAFEAWHLEVRKSDASLFRCGDGYEHAYMDWDWTVWQAAVAHYAPLIAAGEAAVARYSAKTVDEWQAAQLDVDLACHAALAAKGEAKP